MSRFGPFAVYFGHVANWRKPVAQRQRYFGLEAFGLFVGFVLTKPLSQTGEG